MKGIAADNYKQSTSDIAYSGNQRVSGSETDIKGSASGERTGGFEAGQHIRGEIIDMIGRNVRMLLSDGRILNAGVEENTALYIGQKAMFSVETATQNTIVLKLMADSPSKQSAVVIERALDSAGLPHTERNISAVQALLNNRLSIDKNNIHRLLSHMVQNRGVSAETLSFMLKHNIPVDYDTALQYEAYRNDENRLMNQVENIADAFEGFISDDGIGTEGKLEMTAKLIHLINSGDSGEDYQEHSGDMRNVTPDNTGANGTAGITEDKAGIFDVTGMGQKLREGSISPEQLLKSIEDMLTELPKEGMAAELDRLFLSEGFKGILRNSLLRKFTLDAGELSSREKPDSFYQEFAFKLEGIRKLLEDRGTGTEQLSASIEKAADSLDFMGTVNNLFPYLQLPLRLSDGNAHGELFVYTRKGTKRSIEDGISLLLHLDMNRLGATDIYISLKQKNINVHFYMADEESGSLVRDTISELTDKLTEKGYIVVSEISLREEKPDYMSEVLAADEPINGAINRYSFDIRA